MNKKIITLVAALALAGTAIGQTTPFSVTYDFAGVAANTGGTTDPTAVPTATGVVFGSFQAFGVSANPNAAGRFSFTEWSLGATTGSDVFTGAIDLTDYFQVTIAPSALYSMELISIGFTLQRSGTGIRQYAVRSSLDGFTTNLSASISPANADLQVVSGNIFQVVDATTSAETGSLVSLSGSFLDLESAVTFRFYGWNAEGTGGTFSIDNVNVVGSVTAIPEPSTYALVFGVITLGFVVLRRRAKQA